MSIKWFSIVCLLSQLVVAQTPLWAAAATPHIKIRPDHWRLLYRKAGIETQTQTIPGLKLRAYRAKGIIEAPIASVLTVLCDTATAAEWIPDMAHQQVVTKVSALEQITLSMYAVPFPFADRELLLHNHLRLDRQRGALMAEATSVDSPKIPVSKGRVRAHMFCGQTWLRPVSENRTQIEFVLLVAPRGRIPAFLAEFGLRRMPFKFIKALEHRAQTKRLPLRPAYRNLLQQLPYDGVGMQSSNH